MFHSPNVAIMRQCAILLLLSFLLLFVLSPDSYTHQLYGRLDSAMFFMQGHAWMRGMIPYVDFSDSKGPLLLAFYALGAWLSPTTYHGVFWLSVVVYTFIFLFIYLTARILLRDNSGTRSMAACILTMGGVFTPIVHVETRAEDLGCLFIAASLWAMLRLTDSHRHDPLLTADDEIGGCPQGPSVSNTISFLVLGFSLGATLLIKYTFTAMVLLLWLVTYVAVIREHRSPWWKPLILTAIAFGTIVVPFILLFIAEGNLGAFIQSYFVDTLSTVRNVAHGHVPPSPLWETRQRIGGQIAMFVLLAVATVPYIRRHSLYSLLPSLLALSFWLLASLNYVHIHYMQICTPLLIFGAAILVRRRPRWLLTGTLTLLFVAGNAGYQYHHYQNYVGQHCAERTVFEAYSSVINRHRGCSIMFWHCLGNSLGITAEAMPAGRYWFWQAGATPLMELSQDKAVFNREADFVVVPTTPRRLKALEERGYRRIHPELSVNIALYQRMP